MHGKFKLIGIFFSVGFLVFILIQSVIPKIETFASQSQIEEVHAAYFENVIKSTTATAMNGREYFLNDKKIIILNFWATWCVPCLVELPGLQILYDKFKKQGLEIIAINTDTDNAEVEVKKLLRVNDFSFPIVFDHDGEISNKFKVISIPTTFLIKNGKLIELFKGETEFNSIEFHSKIVELLAR